MCYDSFGIEVFILKLSIVVPVYNTRDYLAACLDSVLYPELGDYEVIVVNDGSTDDSGEIARNYAERYPDLFHLITTPNGGLGAARNVGIEQAKGDYLLFLDSDDMLAENALREIMELTDGSFDIAVYDFEQVNPAGTRIGIMPGCDKEGIFTLAEYPEFLFQLPAACNKIVRRSLFMESGIRFPGRVWFEDLRTMPKLYPLADTICYFPKLWYKYLLRPGSITNSSNTARNLEILDAAEDILSWYKRQGLDQLYEEQLCYLAFYNAFLTSSVRVNSSDWKSPVQEDLLRWFTSRFPDYAKNRYIQSMPAKHRLLKYLLLHRMRFSVHVIMKLNDTAKHKS